LIFRVIAGEFVEGLQLLYIDCLVLIGKEENAES
jgi:hypothetical protein